MSHCSNLIRRSEVEMKIEWMCGKATKFRIINVLSIAFRVRVGAHGPRDQVLPNLGLA